MKPINAAIMKSIQNQLEAIQECELLDTRENRIRRMVLWCHLSHDIKDIVSLEDTRSFDDLKAIIRKLEIPF